jgi:hypothetical protein
MITWLADRENAAHITHDWSGFLHDSRSAFYGGFFAVHELAREVQYLAEHGLIRGLTVRDGADLGWTRPRLTAKGRDCNDEYGGDVTKSLNPGQSSGPTKISVTTSPGAQINVGDNNNQHGPLAPAAADSQPSAEKTRWWRRVGNFINSLVGIGTLILTAVLVYLTYLLVFKH